MSFIDPDALECLVALVEEGSFERAAQRLDITQSAVSQRLKALESRIGTVLIVRNRPLQPTQAGSLLLRYARQQRLLRADLTHDLQELAPSTHLGNIEQARISIAINADSIATWALPALQPIIERGIALEIITDDQDFTHEWLRQGQVLGCVTTQPEPLRGCQMIHLGSMTYVAVATPEMVARKLEGQPFSLRIRELPFVAFNRKDDMQQHLVAKALGLRHIALKQIYVPSSEAQVRAVLAGWGASVVPQILVHDLIQQGTLTRLLPGCSVEISLYWHCWGLESDLLQILTKALTQYAASALNNTLRTDTPSD